MMTKMISKLDQKLIQELQKNGRQSYVELARMFGVVEGTIRKRVKRLLDKEIIKIVAEPNIPKLGYGIIAIMGFQVKLEDLRTVAYNLSQNPHICYMAFTAGRYDLMAVIVARSSQELQRLIEKEISASPGIVRTESFINLDIMKGAWGTLDTTELIFDADTT